MQLTSDSPISRLASTLSLLGEPARLAIVVYLLDKKASVGEITQYLEMSQPSISHHLRILKDAHVLKADKDGKRVYYRIDDNHVRTIVESGLSHIMHTNKI